MLFLPRNVTNRMSFRCFWQSTIRPGWSSRATNRSRGTSPRMRFALAPAKLHLHNSTIRPGWSSRAKLRSDNTQRSCGSEVTERRTGAEGPLLRTSPAVPPLFGLSSRGRVLAEGSALDLPHMVPRPGMASLPRCHPERSEGSLQKWAKGPRPPVGHAE
jgi:hypothetical protein